MSTRVAEPLDGKRETAGSKETFVAGLNQALHHEMRRDPKLIVIGEDVGRLGGLFRVTEGLHELYPDRVLDTPIAEGGFVGLAVGAAMAGHPVVVEIQVIDFLWLAVDQVANAGNMHFVSGGQVSVPLVVRGPCGFGTGFGVTHSQHLEATLAARPGVKVLMPSTPADAKGLLTSAIRDPNPVVVFEDSTLYYDRGPLPPDGELVPIGSARVAREGGDCTIATSGRGLKLCLQAAAALAEAGIEAEVVDLRSLKPVDWETLERSVAKTRHFVVALDGPVFCSYAAALAAHVGTRCWGSLAAAPTAVGGIDVAGAVARSAEALAGITPQQLVEAARALVGR